MLIVSIALVTIIVFIVYWIIGEHTSVEEIFQHMRGIEASDPTSKDKERDKLFLVPDREDQ